jgi:predicted RNase H-like nuclease
MNDRAVGRVFSVQMGSGAPPAANADPSGVRVAAGERVEVTVGRQARPDERVTTEGLTLFEVFPEVEHAIVRDDAVATGRAAGVGIQDSMGEVMTSREAREQLGH